MPRYRINQSWSETVYYSNSVEIEADSEQEAREIAHDEQDFSNCDSHDSQYDSGSFDVSDIYCAECDRSPSRCTCEPEEDEPPPSDVPQSRSPTMKLNKYKRNIPGWF